MSYENFTAWKATAASRTPFITVVVPTYNESQRIVPTIAAIAAHLSGRALDFEIIVSDDGSTDDTVMVVRRLGLRNVRVLDPRVNRGKGAAVRAGVMAATGRYVLFTDADLSTPIEHLDEMLEAAQAGSPVVIGSRAAEDATEVNRGFVRELLSAVLRMITRFCLGVVIADTQCGFKLFTREAAQELFADQAFDGFSFDLELLFKASQRGMEITEVPVTWFEAPGSTVKPFRTALVFVRDLTRLRLRRLLKADRTSTQTAEPSKGRHIAVVTALPPSSTTLNEYGYHLTRHLRSHGDVEKITAMHEFGDATLPAGVDGVACWKFDSILNPIRIVREARRQRPDAVIFNIHFTAFGSRKVPAAAGLFTPWMLRLCGVPSIVLLHNLVETVDLSAAGFGENRIVNAVMRRIGEVLTRALLRANKVGTTMPAYVDILREKYGARNVYIAPHGVFDETPFVGSDPKDGVRRVMTFGKFGTYKKLEQLISAYRSLVSDAEFDDVELVIAGTDSPNAAGYIDSVRESCADLDGVVFTGYVEEEDVPDLFQSASVVVFPYTATTGSSGPLHQAGTYGRAVVVPEVGDFIDLIHEEGFVGGSFDPRDVESLRGAIGDVMRSSDLREELGATNHAAANSLPLAEIVGWHVQHVNETLAA